MDLYKSTDDGREKVFRRYPPTDGEKYDLLTMFAKWKPILRNTLRNEQNALPSALYQLKFQLVVQITLHKNIYDENGNITSIQKNEPFFLSDSVRLDDNIELHELFHQINN